jgi:hypothetical protein
MVLLKAQPALIGKSTSSVVLTSWDPQPTLQYYCALSQLTFLCSTVEIDNHFKSVMKTLAGARIDGKNIDKDRSKVEASLKALMNTFVEAMIPTAFQKKDICKLLQHKNSLLQRSGLLYVLAVMQRLLKALAVAAAVGKLNILHIIYILYIHIYICMY